MKRARVEYCDTEPPPLLALANTQLELLCEIVHWVARIDPCALVALIYVLEHCCDERLCKLLAQSKNLHRCWAVAFQCHWPDEMVAVHEYQYTTEKLTSYDRNGELGQMLGKEFPECFPTHFRSVGHRWFNRGSRTAPSTWSVSLLRARRAALLLALAWVDVNASYLESCEIYHIGMGIAIHCYANMIHTTTNVCSNYTAEIPLILVLTPPESMMAALRQWQSEDTDAARKGYPVTHKQWWHDTIKEVEVQVVKGLPFNPLSRFVDHLVESETVDSAYYRSLIEERDGGLWMQ